MLTVADIIEALLGVRPPWATQVVNGAVVDSRQVQRGNLFVALPGEKVDGADYIGEAFERGAILALTQREPGEGLRCIDLRDVPAAIQTVMDLEPSAAINLPTCFWVEDSLAALQKVARLWRSKLNVKVVGITGSVGKSTTKELVAEVLSQKYFTLKSPGNLNNEIGLPLTLLSLTEEHERAVLEMGFYVPGEITFLCGIAQPAIGVITNVGAVHAERAGSIEAIAEGKAELVQALPPAPEGVAILNYDDARVRAMAEKTRAQVLFYGMDPAADLWADEVDGLGLEGVRFQLHYRGEALFLRVPLIGRHSVHTALRAAAVALADGLTWQELVRGLRSPTAQLRLMVVRTENGALMLDDTYNASPQSTLAALNLLDELEGRKIAVLGDMLELGPYEEQGHEMVGSRAAEVVDELITMGQRAHTIARSARNSGLPAEKIMEFDDTEQVVEFLKPRLHAEDVVLVKGSRGMRMDRIVAALEARR